MSPYQNYNSVYDVTLMKSTGYWRKSDKIVVDVMVRK